MSCTLSTNSGSLDNLKVSTWYGIELSDRCFCRIDEIAHSGSFVIGLTRAFPFSFLRFASHRTRAIFNALAVRVWWFQRGTL